MSHKKFLVIGLGRIGRVYIKKLIGLGIDPEQIVVYDVDPGCYEIDEITEHDQIVKAASLEEALAEGVGAAFVLTNTFSHAEQIITLLDAGVTNIYVETPLAMPGADYDKLIAARERHPDAVIHVGYLINFSPAVEAFMQWLEQCNEGNSASLYVREGLGTWEKSRVGDARASAGDRQDNMPHLLGLVWVIAAQNAPSDREAYMRLVCGADTYTDYVDPVAQQRAIEASSGHESLPSHPNSTTTLCLVASGAQVSLRSSFVGLEQRRQLDLSVGPYDGMPTHAVRLSFDLREHGGPPFDSLEIFELGDNGKGRPALTKVMSERYFDKGDGPDKMDREIRAFLDEIEGGERDPRVTTIEGGLRIMEVLALD